MGITTLDAYCARERIDRVRLFKMDIEGAELGALRGARELLARVKPELIACEVQPNALEPRAPWHLVELFAESGYAPRAIDADGALAPFDPASLGQPGLNLCFVPER